MKNIKALTILSLTALITLTGCKRNFADDNELKDALNSNKSEAAKELEELNSDLVQEKVSNHLNYVIEGDRGCSIKVDADVKSIDSSKLAIYEIKKHGMDDELIKHLADKLFDNGTYEYLKPPYVCSEEELDVLHNWLENVIALYEKPDLCPRSILVDQEMWVEAKENYTPGNEQIIPDGQFYVTVPFSTDGEDYSDISEMALCKLSGKIKGNDWVLSSMLLGSYEKVVIYPYYQNQAICSLEEKDSNLIDLCPIKREDGESIAKKCLNDLGYGEYELIDSTKTFSRNTYEITMNGFIYTYARAFNGINTAYLERLNPETNNIDRINTPQEYISIYVDSYGVEQVDFAAHYELGDVISKAPTLLDFDKIDEVARKELKEGMAVTEESDLDIVVNRIEMRYMAVADSNSKYSFVPVWLYHLKYKSYGNERYTTDLCINAIDGTIINNQVNFGFADYIGY